MTARYRVLQSCFIQPHFIKAGAIIETSAPPAEHLEPLNAEAHEAMEGFYKTKVEVLDEETGAVKRTVFPNANKRPTIRDAAEQSTVSLIRMEPFDETPLIGVTQERILANNTSGELQLAEPESTPINVDEPAEPAAPTPPLDLDI